MTYRLADSLPPEAVAELVQERSRIADSIARDRPLTLIERAEVRRLFALKLDQLLDSGCGKCLLRSTEAARIVAENLRYHDGAKYQLHAWCVMPNHVHVLVHLTLGSDLQRVVHSWKSYTAHRLVQVMGCEPPIWQEEYFDRIVRGGDDYTCTLNYILDNPVKAGLVDWPWVWALQ